MKKPTPVAIPPLLKCLCSPALETPPDGKDLQEGQQEQRFSPNAQIDLVPNDPKGDGKEVTGAGALRNSKHTHAHTLML